MRFKALPPICRQTPQRLFFLKTLHVFVLSTLLLEITSSSLFAADNLLTPQEKRDGWVLLFDGQTTKGWMTPKRKPLSASYVQNSSLNPHPCDYMLVHEKQWSNFVLSLDVKISPKCNSGIFFRTFPLKPRPGKDVGWNGMEVAIDDTRTAGYHDAGAIYDLVKPTKNAMKPAGQWNHVVVTCKGAIITVDVNEQRVTTMDLDKWSTPGQRADGSNHKFADIAYKNHPRKGYIGLQDHGSNCWYRNIKIKPLK